MKIAGIRNILAVIALAALVIGFFSLIGSVSEDGSDAPEIADFENGDEGGVMDQQDIEQMVLDAETLKDVEPAAGAAGKKPSELPDNAAVEKQVFGFE